MHFEENYCYHVYNMGNNAQKLFFSDYDYIQFLHKVRKEILPNCEILAYCLMPNHFHFLLYATARSIEPINEITPHIQMLSRKFGTLQSSYSQSVNTRMKRSGSLFRQRTKAKPLNEYITYPNTKPLYAETCFFYIHQNPVKEGIVKKNELWQYSSFADYCGFRNGTLCNKALAAEILEIDFINYYKNANKPLDDDELQNIW